MRHHPAESPQPLSLAEQLAEKECEAHQNWVALLGTRQSLSETRADMRKAATREQHLRNRLRRLRGRHLEQRAVMRSLSGNAERIAAAELRAVEALALARPDIPIPSKVRNVRHAVGFARDHMIALSIPEEVASGAVASLDTSGRRKARGRSVIDALAALHFYATDRYRGGDFKHWCIHGGDGRVSLSANAVAMQESDSVRRDQRMWRARLFPVDPVLDATGARTMFAHVRLDNGPAAPRLYFLDDTRGKTGKIHVGYIGPHLPTASDPT